VGALIPTRGLGVDALEGFAPVFLNAKSHGEGQEFFEHLRRLDGAVKAIGFDMAQKIFEAQSAFEGAGALFAVRGHEPAECADDDAAENAGDDERKRGHAEAGGDGVATPDHDEADDKTGADVGGADAVWATGVVAVLDERVENIVLDVGKESVEAILQ